jgi:hypothetical protein
MRPLAFGFHAIVGAVEAVLPSPNLQIGVCILAALVGAGVGVACNHRTD